VKTLIIAEAGVNHNGSILLAKKLIDIASSSGADIVKFQTFKAENLVTKKTKQANYQKRNDKSKNQFEMLKKLELSNNDFRTLFKYANKKNIEFLSTAFDIETLDFLHNLGQKRFKIPSGEINNLPYLRHVAKFKKEVILSTGMASMNEIKIAVNILKKNGLLLNKISILHCTSAYPAPFEEVNLMAMQKIQSILKTRIGYSDHTLGIEVSLAAVALGATIIEKHFTLNNKMKGPDHKASIDPFMLKALVRSIRNIEKSIGNPKKIPSKAEYENILIVRKSIVAKQKIKIGEKFTENNITTKRPANGLSPMFWDQIIGKISDRDYKKDDFIKI
jgi:N,N'-diacetyllegionaminate synthase